VGQRDSKWMTVQNAEVEDYRLNAVLVLFWIIIKIIIIITIRTFFQMIWCFPATQFLIGGRMLRWILKNKREWSGLWTEIGLMHWTSDKQKRGFYICNAVCDLISETRKKKVQLLLRLY
jgi:hypothetical protein